MGTTPVGLRDGESHGLWFGLSSKARGREKRERALCKVSGGPWPKGPICNEGALHRKPPAVPRSRVRGLGISHCSGTPSPRPSPRPPFLAPSDFRHVSQLLTLVHALDCFLVLPLECCSFEIASTSTCSGHLVSDSKWLHQLRAVGERGPGSGRVTWTPALSAFALGPWLGTHRPCRPSRFRKHLVGTGPARQPDPDSLDPWDPAPAGWVRRPGVAGAAGGRGSRSAVFASP